MIGLSLIVVGLAVARLTLILVRDDIAEPLRKLIFLASPPENSERDGHYYQSWHRLRDQSVRSNVKRDILGRRYVYQQKAAERPPGFIGRALSCPDCSSVWIAFVAVVAYYNWPVQTFWLSLPFALALITSMAARRY